jgi:hypothetical protein
MGNIPHATIKKRQYPRPRIQFTVEPALPALNPAYWDPLKLCHFIARLPTHEWRADRRQFAFLFDVTILPYRVMIKNQMLFH